MKNLYIITIALFSLSFASAQQTQEVRSIHDNDNGFEINLIYHLSDQEKPMATEDVTKVLGEPISENYWTTVKDNNALVNIKMINGYLFVRGFDRTADHQLKDKLLILDESLKKYSDIQD